MPETGQALNKHFTKEYVNLENTFSQRLHLLFYSNSSYFLEKDILFRKILLRKDFMVLKNYGSNFLKAEFIWSIKLRGSIHMERILDMKLEDTALNPTLPLTM